MWLFDAKYRIKTEKSRFDCTNEDIEKVDYVPNDAINQMHRYRDALIHLSQSKPNSFAKKSRPVFGAFALYPGYFEQGDCPNPYADAIDEVGIGAFALLPSQRDQGYCGHLWLSEFLKKQIGVGNGLAVGDSYNSAGIGERLYVQDASRIPHYGMKQVLYPDLTMTIALGGQGGRNKEYFKRFEDGTAKWYHVPEATFIDKLQQHVAEEIRYLALAQTSTDKSSTKQIDKLWPVKRVTLVPRDTITEDQAGSQSEKKDLYYLFELGKPLSLQTPITGVPHRPIKNSLKLTTLSDLEKAAIFSEISSVYLQAFA